MAEIPGSIARHAWVTDECRANKGDIPAGREAVERLMVEYGEMVHKTVWPKGTRFHFVLTLERASND